MKKRRPFQLEAAQFVSDAVRLFAALCLLAFVGIGTVLARSWSYHYVPRTPKPSPEAAATTAATVPAEQLSTARLLKQAIVSDLAIFTEEGKSWVRTCHVGTIRSIWSAASRSLIRWVHQKHSVYFASLSGYYLGARGEKLYDCIALRKGKALEPFLKQYLGNANPNAYGT